MEQNNQRPKRRFPQVSKRHVKWLIAAVTGVATAFACRLLPEQWQLPCTILAKLMGLLVGRS